ncbi:MAG: B12-binding domain-containing radical SAM protein [Oligoflexia bacterium]|nr:B12-binding domain-containing radical SAM protein [Oligoflexia bacterium]
MLRKNVVLVNLTSDMIRDREFYRKNKGQNFINIGLLVVATMLKKQGYNISIIDMAYEENYQQLIRSSLDETTAFVGLSVMTSQVPAALEISRLVKNINPSIPVVWGGPHPTFFIEETARSSLVDVAVVNESLKILPELAKRLSERDLLTGLHGIAYKNDKQIIYAPNTDLDDIYDLGAIDHSCYDSTLYTKSPLFTPPLNKDQVVSYPLITGLGCCFKCRFCLNVILKRKYRSKTPEVIIEELKDLQKKYGANAIWFMDEDFFINKKRTIELFKLVEKENLKFYWRSWVRVDHFKENYLDKKTVSWLTDLGWVWSSLGAESGSVKSLTYIQKGIQPEQIINSAKILSEVSSKNQHWARYTFIVGLPNETIDDVLKTFSLASKIRMINPLTDITIAIFRPYPGSPMSKELMDKGNLSYPEKLEDWEGVFSNHGFMDESSTPWLSQKERSEIATLHAFFGMIKGGSIQKIGLLRYFINQWILWRIENNFFLFPIEKILFYSFWIRIRMYFLSRSQLKRA